LLSRNIRYWRAAVYMLAFVHHDTKLVYDPVRKCQTSAAQNDGPLSNFCMPLSACRTGLVDRMTDYHAGIESRFN